MSNSELSLFNTPDGVEVVISRGDGETFATQAGYARMSGKDRSVINRRCKGLHSVTFEERQSLSGSGSEGVAENYIVESQVQTSKGVQKARLIPEPTILNWLSKDNPQLLTSFAQLGLRATLHRWAGFEVGSSAFQVPQDYASALRLAADEYERRISAEQNLSQAESTLEQYRAILSPGACPDVDQISKALAIPKMGRNNFYKWLRRKKFIQSGSTKPYQQMIDRNLARVMTVSWTDEKTSEEHTGQRAVITFKGIEWILQKLEEEGYEVGVDAKFIWDNYAPIKPDKLEGGESS